MKKFVIVDRWGTWERINGKKVIDCTVKGHIKVAESNSYTDLCAPLHVDYREDGTWHAYSVERRAYAKKLGLA